MLTSFIKFSSLLVLLLFLVSLTPSMALAVDCPKGDSSNDLVVFATAVHIPAGSTCTYRFINIYGGGSLILDDDGNSQTKTHLWAKSILVEKDGTLIAGSEDVPFRSNLTIHLYGSNQDPDAILCKTNDEKKSIYCGVPANDWGHGDFFAYDNLPDELVKVDKPSITFFGRKVLAVSYGGTLQLFGAKGMTKGALTDGGKSWARLNANAAKGSTTITIDRAVDWAVGDEIVITTTDFLPSHSEQRKITAISSSGSGTVITLDKPLTYPHNGSAYDLTTYKLGAKGITTKPFVDTRAAVALLSRNIKIVSGGKNAGDELLHETSTDTDRYYGGHTIIRQGFTKVQIQGVEFYQMGQGGIIARSPLQFHGTYNVPADTFVRDCSIHDSMSRWIELRGVGGSASSPGVLLERNVGYKSIGHGYMSAGHEAYNTYRANIGIYARPALIYQDNPRNVPGIYAQSGGDFMVTKSDYMTPSVFMIANPYNTYEGNMAVGAGACGSCYWIVPGHAVSPPDSAPAGYISAMGINNSHSPLFSFKGNFCSTAQYSLITIGGITSCNGIGDRGIKPVVPIHQYSLSLNSASNYLPKLINAGNCIKGNTSGCTVTVIDNYTSSFHWAQQNWSAIWLRNNWFLYKDSALTDIMGPGLTMVSGGSYEQVINGYWALTRNSVFIGQTQEGNDFATAAGPKLNANTNLQCEGRDGGFCLFSKEGISIPTDNFLNYQRFYNIYDGPVYQELNGFLNIKAMQINTNNGEYIYGVKTGDAMRGLGIPKAKEVGKYGGYRVGDCILTNSAIAWKQPNGFYYPPAFYSQKLFFDKVDLRHFVLVPLFSPGTQTTDAAKLADQYCTYSPNIFDSFTDVDRQTEINDIDGSTSGIKGIGETGSISLNNDTFYHVPKMTYQCASEQSCFQTPYDHVTVNVFPKCLSKGGDPNAKDCSWVTSCGDPTCNRGVPIYRQYLNTNETQGIDQRMMMLGQGIGQRVNLIANNGKYYIDTGSKPSGKTDFQSNHTYYVYLLYSKPDSKVTFQVYVGKNGFDISSVKGVRVGSKSNDGTVLTPPFEFNEQPIWLWDAPVYSNGILTVTMDMSKFPADFQKGYEEACKPSSVCSWKGSYCGCAGPKATDIDYNCQEDVCKWSSKTMECPANGCIGFQFTLPSTFVADGSDNRPATEPFPSTWTNDTWKWSNFIVDESIAGACAYHGDPPYPPVKSNSIYETFQTMR